MKEIECVLKRIRSIVANSPVPEDAKHSEDTLSWVLRLKPDADEALRIAALGHDIERAVPELRVRREDFKSYDEFKEAHAANSAEYLERLMRGCDVADSVIRRVVFLVRHHETGGQGDADLLKDADCLSFFGVNLPYFFERNGQEETAERVLWGYRRLSENLREKVEQFEYEDEALARLVRRCIRQASRAVPAGGRRSGRVG